ncbi:hypothetical protein BT96DRAFT_977606 [Gymnopus androsaceus JB14]|uniref:Uncharacterized protein n=1 Tax=Gymnopus androsaceus JB14 TaxID=1447944 RepID=A0A6A4HG80_9AGAR|nr:hypothetical protein BT96DRAFT_977606 [Gymnopus androsaceus JB14]
MGNNATQKIWSNQKKQTVFKPHGLNKKIIEYIKRKERGEVSDDEAKEDGNSELPAPKLDHAKAAEAAEYLSLFCDLVENGLLSSTVQMLVEYIRAPGVVEKSPYPLSSLSTTTNSTRVPVNSRVPTPMPDASPTLQVQADTSIAAGNKLESTSGPKSPKHQGIRSTIVDTLDTVLKVLNEASAPLPPLQAAIGGVCECISLYKV